MLEANFTLHFFWFIFMKGANSSGMNGITCPEKINGSHETSVGLYITKSKLNYYSKSSDSSINK